MIQHPARSVWNLEGKRVLITGASKGLGAVAAKALAREGAILALLARSADKLEEVRTGCQNAEKHKSIPVDLTDMQQLRISVSQAKEFLGEVDVILHVAGGGLGLRHPLLSSEDIEKLLSLNIKAAVEINHLLLPEMMARKNGNVVQVCSIASAEATGSVGYNTAKAALAAYVRSLGREVAASGVVVTGILPGGFYAPENSWMRFQARDPEGVKKFVEERLPRKFLGQAEEIIPLLLFLCSDQASMMGGCLVPIDAGEGKAYLS